MLRLVFVLVSSAAVVLAACNREDGERRFTPASRVLPATGAASVANNEDAIHALAEALCERETRCDNVGTDKRYDNRDDCVSQLNQAGYQNLAPDKCPRGVDEDELTHCVAAIRKEACEPRGDSVERIEVCAPKTLCRD